MEQGASQGVKLQGYQDVTQDFRAACQGELRGKTRLLALMLIITHLSRYQRADMHHGQMAHAAGFTLLDSMGAIEIMDPRMDSGMFPVPADLVAECDRLSLERSSSAPSFDPNANLSAADVCWIMDRTFACEVGCLSIVR